MMNVSLIRPVFRFMVKETRRLYRVLAIESSCDDSSVALLDYDENIGMANIISHLKSTLNSSSVGGIIPTEALLHHQQAMPLLIDQLMQIPQFNDCPLDLIAVTRGPGMVGSLSVGLNLAKGLSLGLSTSVLGVHHMLGHLLIPRMSSSDTSNQINFPFISLLASGGHTMLVLSKDVLNHEILIDTIDIAIGDSLDKCGRELGIKANMIAKEMEIMASQRRNKVHSVVNLPNPLSMEHNKNKLSFSFASYITSLKNQIKDTLIHGTNRGDSLLLNQIAYDIQESHFDHLIYKIKQWVQKNIHLYDTAPSQIGLQFIASGGVSSNNRLRYRLENELKPYFKSFHYPAQNDLYTDNAVMIGWAAIELVKHFKIKEGCTIYNSLDILPLRKWDLTDLVNISKWNKQR